MPHDDEQEHVRSLGRERSKTHYDLHRSKILQRKKEEYDRRLLQTIVAEWVECPGCLRAFSVARWARHERRIRPCKAAEQSADEDESMDD